MESKTSSSEVVSVEYISNITFGREQMKEVSHSRTANMKYLKRYVLPEYYRYHMTSQGWKDGEYDMLQRHRLQLSMLDVATSEALMTKLTLFVDMPIVDYHGRYNVFNPYNVGRHIAASFPTLKDTLGFNRKQSGSFLTLKDTLDSTEDKAAGCSHYSLTIKNHVQIGLVVDYLCVSNSLWISQRSSFRTLFKSEYFSQRRLRRQVRPLRIL